MSHLTRRGFLGGAAALVTLPWLESLAVAQEPAARRFLTYYVPNGVYMDAYTPASAGRDFDLTPILDALRPLRDKITVITGLDNLPGVSINGGEHPAGTGAFLTCTRVNKTDGANLRNGISVDQVAANVIGGDTRRHSLQLGIEGGTNIGGCDGGYSCAYARNISWASPTQPLPKTISPQVLFDRLFEGFDSRATAEEQDRRRRHRRSVLDATQTGVGALSPRLGASDRAKLDEYLTGIRELELRIGNSDVTACLAPERPPENPPFLEHLDLMTDLMVKAFECDQTRVISFMLGNSASNRSFPWLGLNAGHHIMSHYEGAPDIPAALTAVGAWEVSHLATLCARLDAVQEGERTLLDNTVVYWSSEVEDGNTHSHRNLPILLVGGGNMGLETGRHLVYDRLPLANLYKSTLDLLGAPVESFGNSTGGLPGLI